MGDYIFERGEPVADMRNGAVRGHAKFRAHFIRGAVRGIQNAGRLSREDRNDACRCTHTVQYRVRPGTRIGIDIGFGRSLQRARRVARQSERAGERAADEFQIAQIGVALRYATATAEPSAKRCASWLTRWPAQLD